MSRETNILTHSAIWFIFIPLRYNLNLSKNQVGESKYFPSKLYAGQTSTQLSALFLLPYKHWYARCSSVAVAAVFTVRSSRRATSIAVQTAVAIAEPHPAPGTCWSACGHVTSQSYTKSTRTAVDSSDTAALIQPTAHCCVSHLNRSLLIMINVTAHCSYRQRRQCPYNNLAPQ
jgi:hypothetical protein